MQGPRHCPNCEVDENTTLLKTDELYSEYKKAVGFSDPAVPEDILKHPDKTYPAYRWATVINNGYIAFWDSEYDHDEFVITDIGMT